MSRDILKAALSTDGGIPSSLNLLQTSIGELSALLAEGTVTSVSLVKAYIANIERDNVQGLGLRAIIQVAPVDSVLKIAESLDEERRAGTVRGPLHGMNTSAGNTALQQSIVPGDAEAIRRLRAAGAIILAKANLTEFSGYKGATGWSAVAGQCSSPYIAGGDLTGSSAGSAAGVCAGFGAVAIGAETAGSIVGPANRSALFGIRPTNDLLSIEGVVPVSIGPIGFTVADVAIVLDAMADNDGKFLRAAQNPQLHGMKIGLARQHFMDDSDARYLRPGCFVDQCISATLLATKKMREAGAIVINVDMDLNASDINTFIDNQWVVLAADFKEDMTKYLEQLKESPVRSLEELVQWNKDHAAEELPSIAPDQAELIEALTAPSKDCEEYRRASALSLDIGGTRGFDHIFDKHDLDAAIFPMDFGHSSFLAGPKAYASGVAPLGVYENGVPFGLLFVVRPYQEEKLISILSRYEEIMPKRTTPKSLQR